MPRRRLVYPPGSVTYNFAHGLRTARRKQGMTQRELAAAAGVSKNTVAAAEGVIVGVSLAVAYQLAQALGVTVSDLTGENDG